MSFHHRLLSITILACLTLLPGCGKPPIDYTPHPTQTPAEVHAEVISTTPTLPPLPNPEAGWLWWRGPLRNCTAVSGSLPRQYSSPDSAIWKASIPGKGHCCPIVFDNTLYLTSAVQADKTQIAIAYDLSNGSQLWKKVIHTGGFDPNVHQENSQASSTLACDGQHLFCVFMNAGQIHATALNLEGELVWTKVLGDFDSNFGYGSSPTLFGDYLYIPVDHKKGGFLTALRRDTGETLWLIQRPSQGNYASPVIAKVNDQMQVLMSGNEQLVAYDAYSGKEQWQLPVLTSTTVNTATIISDDSGNAKYFAASGGYPQSQTACVSLLGTPSIQWKNDQKIYIPSLIVHEANIYAVNDDGIAYSWNLETGKENWKKRLGGNFSASPLLVGDELLLCSEKGAITILKADPAKAQIIAEDQLGDEIFASPTLAQGKLFLRYTDRSQGEDQQTLACFPAP